MRDAPEHQRIGHRQALGTRLGTRLRKAAAVLVRASSTIVVVVRKCRWVGIDGEGARGSNEGPPSTPTPETPRSATRKLV